MTGFVYLSALLHFFFCACIRAESPCPNPHTTNDTDTYDYIVTGSGPGGGTIAANLARAGYSVLLVEAGDDQSNDIGTQILALQSSAPVAWDFYVRHFADDERTLRYNLLVWRKNDGTLTVGKEKPEANATMLGVYYPRGATLGGSAIVNAAATWLPPDSDWDIIGNLTGERSWNGPEMRKLFQEIEHNNYLSPSNGTGHGFNGFLHTNIADRSIYSQWPNKIPVFKAALTQLGKPTDHVLDDLVRDGNFLSPDRDRTEGLFGLPFHAEKNWKRWSPRDYILATTKATNSNGTQSFPLTLKLNTLTTRIIISRCGNGSVPLDPRAYGIEYLTGTAMYSGDRRYNASQPGTKGRAYARKEVIVSGGTFNSPQLLQLSGIGPAYLLHRYNINVKVHSPGVGQNLQDNYELPIYGLSNVTMVANPNSSDSACTFGATGDPCVELWKQGKGPYVNAQSNAWAFLLKTNHSVDGERDVYVFGGDFVFRGFVPPGTIPPGFTSPTGFSFSMVKMHPQNTAGTVQIRSPDPRDTPGIQFNFFKEGADTDIGALLDTIAWGRRAFFNTSAPVGPLKPIEPPCPTGKIGGDGFCADRNIDADWISEQAFGHHPTGTNKIGADDDEMAVLDGRLRVRGVAGLRVVDASAFPRCPGAFPVVATFLLSQKATGFVLEDAGKW